MTIDTGANICCMRHTLVPHTQIIKNVSVVLTGPNNEPLTVLGSTIIQVTINSQKFEILTYVVKDLSCTFIIGNDFLTKHKAHIDFETETLTLNKYITIKTHNHCKNASINKIKEETINIFTTEPSYSIAHCISADLKMSRGIASLIKTVFGDATPILSNFNVKIGDAIPIKLKNRTIYFLVTKNRYFHKPKLDDIKKSIKNLKKIMITQHDFKLAIPTIAAGLDKCNWTIIKQIIYAEFHDTNINVLICHINNKHITNTWKTKEHNELLHLTTNLNQIILEENTNKPNTEDDIALAIFSKFKPGENVPGDGNCGIYALCNALNDGKINNIISISKILDLLNMTCLPNYYWSDDELASIADNYGHDTYVFNDTNKMGYVYQDNNNETRPLIMLYNVNNNTHWIPGTKSIKESSKIPIKIITTNNIIPLQSIIKKVNETIKTPKTPPINKLETNYNDNNLKTNKPKQTNHISTNIYNNKLVKATVTDQKETIKDKEGTTINISPYLELHEHIQVTSLLKKYIHLFTSDTSKVKPANIEPCEIPMKHNYKDPKFNAPHRISPNQREELKTQLDKLLKADIIRPIISKFAAPAFLVKKKQPGTYRLVVSYKELNDRVDTDQYPIPRTSDLLRALEGSQYFSSLDLNSGFFQIPVKPEDQYKLAFTSIHGLMTFTRLPQGFKNSSAIFQRKLNEAFSALLYKSLIIYIDDLASYGKNFSSALLNLEEAFKILDKINFSLKTNKCHFFNPKIKLLGHIITREGIKPLNTNTIAITEFKQPRTQKDVRSFIGMCSYYRKHVKDFAKIAHPLTELIKGDKKKITWLNEHEESFNKLKNHLTSEPLLSHFNDDKQVYLTIDASMMGLGACLEQADDNNILHPVGFASRKLLENEKTYSSTTLELLGLCFGIMYFREYLWGRYFIVFCDNISLQYYKTLKIPSARIARLTLKLLDFNFEIIYKKGKENRVADALSRNAINIINENDDNDLNKTLDNYDIKSLQSKDQFCINIINAINNKDVSINIKRKSRQFIILNEILYYKRFSPPKNITHILVVPKQITNDLLKAYHESPLGGHTGMARTIHKLQNKYYWPTLSKDTTAFIKSCHNCQINKKLVGKPIGQLQPIRTSNRPMNRLTFDYLGPLPSSNKKKFVLVAACNNTKYIFTKATESASADSTVKFIIQIVSLWGTFRQFSSDRGTHFKNNTVSEVLNNLGIKQILSTAYSPETQGFVERINGVLCNSLKNYINNNNQTRWSYFLPYITLSYNSTPQTTTKQSPFYLMHGFEPLFPIDNKIIPQGLPYDIHKSLEELNNVRNEIPKLIENAQQIQKKYYDEAHRIIKYNQGDMVMVQFPFQEVGKSPKLAPKYRGPFEVIQKISDLNYKIKLVLNNKTTEDIIHVRRLKPYYLRINTST